MNVLGQVTGAMILQSPPRMTVWKVLLRSTKVKEGHDAVPCNFPGADGWQLSCWFHDLRGSRIGPQGEDLTPADAGSGCEGHGLESCLL